MSLRAHREEFLMAMGRAGASIRVTRELLRLAKRAQRLAEASCCGYWPADDGQRDVMYCPECEGGWVASSYRRPAGATRDAARVCPDCACERQIAAVVAAGLPGWRVMQQGDPRGWVVRLVTPDGREMGVPA